MSDNVRLCPEPVRKIVIAGGGSCGWMAAAALSRMIEHAGVGVTLIESGESDTDALAAGTMASIHGFNQMLELDENDFLRRTQGTFKLGIEFADWHSRGSRYIHPCGLYGTDGRPTSFISPGSSCVSSGSLVSVTSVNITCARSPPDEPVHAPEGGAQAALAALRYAFHIDAGMMQGICASTARPGECAGSRAQSWT